MTYLQCYNLILCISTVCLPELRHGAGSLRSGAAVILLPARLLVLRWVDCKAPNPEWASINLGIMVCLECSGLHRQMGTHISKVRSLKLDAKCWVGALLAHMCSIGNTAFNAVWEANLPPDAIQPQYYPENNAVSEGAVLQCARGSVNGSVV